VEDKVLYSEARDTIGNGDLISFRGTHFQSRLFRWWSGSTWKPVVPDDVPSHVAIAVWMHVSSDLGPDRLCVIESVKRGVRMVPLSGLLARYPGRIYWHEHIVPEGDLSSAYGFRARRLTQAALKLWDRGLGYPSWHQHFLTAFAWLRWLRGHVLGQLADIDPYAVMCSECIAQACIDAGYDSGGKEACLFTPLAVTQIPWFRPGVEIVLPKGLTL
jgi:uncharacterized membrane protein